MRNIFAFGFVAETDPPLMISQIQLTSVGDMDRAERDMVQRLASELHDEYAKRHQRERAPATWEQSHDFADWSMKEIGLREIDGKWERVK